MLYPISFSMAQSLYTKGLDLSVSLKLTMYSEVLLLKGRDEW